MPQIPEFTASMPGITAPEGGVEARAMAARRIGAFSHQTGEELASAFSGAAREAQQFLDHQEISHGVVAYAGLMSDLTDQWNETAKNADPNDPTVAGRFRAQMEDKLDEFAGSFHTQRGQDWAEARVDALRNHIFEKTAADMSTLAGVATTTNMRRMSNAWSDTAARDPSAVGHLVEPGGVIDSSVDAVVGSAPNMTPETAAKISGPLKQQAKEEAAKAGVYGAIMNARDPEAVAADMVRRYPDLINGVEADQMAKTAKAQAKSLEVQSRSAALLKKQQGQLAVDAQANQIWNDNVAVDANGKTTIKPEFFQQIIRLPGQFPDAANALNTAKTYLDWGQSQLRERREVINSDPGTRTQLLNGLFDPAQPTTKIDILRAEAQDKLSSHDASTLRELSTELETAPLKGPVWQETLKAVHAKLTANIPGMPGKDEAGEEAYASFVQQFIPEYLRQSRSGTLPPNALDLKDPKSLIRQSMGPFELTPAQKIQRYKQQFSPAGATPGGAMLTGPGETITGVDIQNAPPLPPAAGRKVGQTYATPRGPMKWTGTGWVTP